jgi:hypothetical protein
MMTTKLSRVDVGWLLVGTVALTSIVTLSASQSAVTRQKPQPLTPEQRQHVADRRAASKTAREAAFKESVVRQQAFRATFDQAKAQKLAAENERVRGEIARLSRGQ